MATIAGAKVAHLDHKIGTLTPGTEADIIMLATDHQRPALSPPNFPFGALFSAPF